MTITSVYPRIGCVMGGRTALIGQMKTPPYVVSDLMSMIVAKSKSSLDYMYMTELMHILIRFQLAYGSPFIVLITLVGSFVYKIWLVGNNG